MATDIDEHVDDAAQCLISDVVHPGAGLIGIGLGPIDPVFITRDKWPLHKEEGKTQYGKFAQLMVNRIRGGESNEIETKRFTDMFSELEHWPWIAPVLEMLPELDDNGPLPWNDQMSTLLQHIQKTIDARQRQHYASLDEQQPPGQSKPSVTGEAVNIETRAKLAKLLFGPDGEAKATPAMKRLLDSWAELGYPSEAIQNAINNKKRSGKALSRDNLGLPAELTEEHLYHLHVVKAQKRPAPEVPGFYGSSQRAPRSTTPIKKYKPKVPVGDVSTDEERERIEKAAGRQFPPTASNPEPYFTDSPPDSLCDEIQKRVKGDSISITDAGPTPEGAKKDFWHFERVHAHDYDMILAPVTEADRTAVRTHWRQPNDRVSTTTTKDGIVVMRGFGKPSPEVSDRMLKEIDDAAANLSVLFTYSGEPVPNSKIAATASHASEGEHSQQHDGATNVTQGVNGKSRSASDSTVESANATSAPATLECGLAIGGTDLATTSNGATVGATMEETKVSKDPKARLQSLDSKPEFLSKARKVTPMNIQLTPTSYTPLGNHDDAVNTNSTPLPELVRTLKDKEKVVFHCALSQQRGPGAALRYMRERDRVLGGAEEANVKVDKKVAEEGLSGEDVKSTIGDNQEVEKVEGTQEEDQEGSKQEVWVLDGGFVKWQERYGTDERLTDDYAPDIWCDS
ncbi:MAG: hypothetical protein Q9207_006538 [Kuettlingeria erythrocarpa]